MTFLKNFWKEDQGQDLIEYTLLLAFVALASAALFLERRRQHPRHLEHRFLAVGRGQHRSRKLGLPRNRVGAAEELCA